MYVKLSNKVWEPEYSIKLEELSLRASKHQIIEKFAQKKFPKILLKRKKLPTN